MKVFGYDITPQIRDDAVFVVAVALLLNGVGAIVVKAFDTAAPIGQWEQIEQRLKKIESLNDSG